jgi:hypothetical protein
MACGKDRLSSVRSHPPPDHDASVFRWALDLIELDGDDLRLEPLGARKATLARAAPGLRLNEDMEEEDGPLVFHHAWLGLSGRI